MSNMGKFISATSLGGIVALTGNAGGAVGPDGVGNIDIVGSGNITVTGNPATNTLTTTFSGTTDHAVQVGNAVGSLTSLGIGLTAQVLKGNTAADPSWGAVDLTTDVTGLLPVGSGGTGVGTLLIHGLLVGNTVAAVNSLAVGATNQVLLGNTGADPSWGTVGNAALTNSSVTLSNGNNITITGSPLSLGGTATINVSGTTQYAVQVGDVTGSLDSLVVGVDGYVLIGATGGNPAFAALGSAGGTIVYTPGANTLNLETGATVPVSFTTDSGSAVPALGVLSILGGTNIGTTGATSIVTVNLDTSISGMVAVDFATGGRIGTATSAGNTTLLQAYDTLGATYVTFATLTANNPPTMDLATGVTIGTAYIYRAGGTDIPVTDGGTGASTLLDHGVLLGAGTSAVSTTAVGATNTVLHGNTGADPSFSAVDMANDVTGTLPVANGGTGFATTTAYAVLCGGTTATNPFQPIASVGTAAQILTSNGAGALPTFQDPAASGIAWSVITADLNPMVVDNGYICNKSGLLTLTLPTTAAVGTILRVTGMNTDLGWKIAQSANQQIHCPGGVSTTAGVGGNLASILKRDSVELVCVVANLEWNCVSMLGNLTIV